MLNTQFHFTVMKRCMQNSKNEITRNRNLNWRFEVITHRTLLRVCKHGIVKNFVRAQFTCSMFKKAKVATNTGIRYRTQNRDSHHIACWLQMALFCSRCNGKDVNVNFVCLRLRQTHYFVLPTFEFNSLVKKLWCETRIHANSECWTSTTNFCAFSWKSILKDFIRVVFNLQFELPK